MTNLSSPFMNQKELCEEYCVVTGGHICRIGDTAVFYQNNSKWYSRIMLEKTAEPNQVLDQIVKTIKFDSCCELFVYETDYGLTDKSDSLKMFDQPRRDLYKKLTSERFAHEITTFGMEYDLSKDHVLKVQDQHHIFKVEVNTIEEWCRALDAGYCVEESCIVDDRDDGTDYESFLRSGKVVLYGFFEKRMILGTGLLYKGEDTAGIHEVSVDPSYRRKGIATSLVRRMLHDAQREQYKKAVLLSTKMGFELYEKIGFKPVSIIEHWRLK